MTGTLTVRRPSPEGPILLDVQTPSGVLRVEVEPGAFSLALSNRGVGKPVRVELSAPDDAAPPAAG